MVVWGLIVAAGRGERLGGVRPKALEPLAGEPMLCRSVAAFAAAPAVSGLVVVLPPAVGLPCAPGRLETLTATGGASRASSVRAGLGVLPAGVGSVVVHDAARPLVTPELIARALAGLEGADGAICAVPVTDTIKRADGDAIAGTVEREGLWRAQTPQAFRVEALRRAHAGGDEATDDAALVERAGGRVVIVPGDERNIKVTTKEDLVLAEALVRA